ncbi:MAG: MgtC/SapB family protein [Longimicrobiales bacterium]
MTEMELSVLDGLSGLLTGPGGAVLRLFLAALLGGAVGVERETSNKPAGFRTHILISLGAALFTELSIGMAYSVEGFRADPGRIAAQIVTGIGFLGAGTILQGKGNIVGLTTAASIWVVAAIGMAVGAGFPLLAITTTVLAVVALRVLWRYEKRLQRRVPSERRLEVEMGQDPELLEAIERIGGTAGAAMELIEVHRIDDHYVASFRMRGTHTGREAAVRALLGKTGIHRITVR